MKHLFSGLMALGVLVGLAGDANAQPNYSFTTLDVPGANATFVRGNNASGQIVGSYWDGTTDHGFLLDNGGYTTIDQPGSDDTEVFGINASGQMVGWSGLGFLLDNGVYTTFNPFPGRGVKLFPNGINDSGQIVG